MHIVIADPLEQSKIGVARTLAELPSGLRNELAHALRILRGKGVIELEFVRGDLSGTIAIRSSGNVLLSEALPRRCSVARADVERALRLLLWFDMPKSTSVGRTHVRSCRFCGVPLSDAGIRCYNQQCASQELWGRIESASRGIVPV